ncbi:MAG: hypothetical protein HRT45_01200 [Bdellovibrionales bacterium]|nr:hypothetical protein [Bdellovibrionales bacterium]
MNAGGQRKVDLKKVILTQLFCVTVLLLTQNCGMKAEHSASLSSKACGSSDLLSECDRKQLKAFEKSFYPVLKNKCSTCHSNGPGIGRFANDNAIIAWSDFSSIGKFKIMDQALNENHQPGYTGPANASAIANANESYSAEEASFELCKQNSALSCEPGAARYGLKTKSKAMRYSESWNTVTFEYPADFQKTVPELEGKITTFTMEYRLYRSNDNIVGYQIRKPNLTSSEDLKVEGLRIEYNWNIDPYLTTYLNMNGYVSEGESNLIETDSETYGILFDSEIENLDLNYMAVIFDGVEFKTKTDVRPIDDDDDGIPPDEVPVTNYQELTSTGGIFRENCQGCHSPQGGRSPYITSSTLSNLKSGGYIRDGNSLGSVIYQRMTDPVSPMPPSGVLPSLQRRTIKKWIDDGAAAN